MQLNQANRGRALEDLLELIFEGAGSGVKMFRQNNKWVPLRSGKAFPHKGAPVDFIGVIAGTPIALECKESAARKSLPLNSSRFPGKEIQALREFSEAGGWAFVIVAFWQAQSLAVFRLETFRRLWLKYQEGGRASLRLADADAVVLVSDAANISALLAGLAGE